MFVERATRETHGGVSFGWEACCDRGTFWPKTFFADGIPDMKELPKNPVVEAVPWALGERYIYLGIIMLTWNNSRHEYPPPTVQNCCGETQKIIKTNVVCKHREICLWLLGPS